MLVVSDVSNVMLALSPRYPIIEKIETTRFNSARRTAFHYCGPDLEQVNIDYTGVLNLPEYRNKHLLFNEGKLFLGIPILPVKIPGLTTVRLKQTEKPWPWPIDTSHGIDMKMATVTDLRKPLSIEQLVGLETERLGIIVIDLILDSTDAEAVLDDNNSLENYCLQGFAKVDETGESSTTIEEETMTLENPANATVNMLDHLAWSILPDQNHCLEIFNQMN